MKTKLFLKQKVVNFLLSVLCCFSFAACNEDDLFSNENSSSLTTRASAYMQDFTPVGNEAVGTEVMLTDKRDGNVYRCIKMADGRWWMGENLKYNMTGSVVYNNDAANLETYGRLYKWQEAMAAVPENWNVPDDGEWKALEMALGMTRADADAATAWRNSGNVGAQLKGNGNSGMGLVLGGYQHTSGSYLNLGIYGRYWTSTESGVSAFDRDVYSSKSGVYRGTFSKAYRYSVRCVLQEKETIQYMQTFVPKGDEAVGTERMLIDKRDSITYRCIKMADGRWWMGENLKYNIAGSVSYNDEPANVENYGRLYSWQEAMDAIPENWSLPGDDDWKILEVALGMTPTNADSRGWRYSGSVGTQLKVDGSSGMILLLSGLQGTVGNFGTLDKCGFYWTSMENDSSRVWLRQLDSGNIGIFRDAGSKMCRYSVRYIKDL